MKPLLEMSRDEFINFVNARRAARAAKVYRAKARKSEGLSVATLAKDLGIDKHSLAKKLEKELSAKD